MCKYIVVSGGVISGIGKGISAASIGLLLRLRGETVQVVKFDPYLNVTASLLSPYQHGEVFLCDDGSETDLDLGHYERIAGIEVSSKNICTTGKLNLEIIEEERAGKYIGQTVQIVPHVTDKIQEKLLELGKTADIVIVEIGGTVGDLESGHFYRAIRQFRQRHGHDNVLLVHVAPILWVNTIGEFKTKPLQHSIEELQRFGLMPDALLCRCDREIPDKILDKVSHMIGISRESVFEAPDVDSVYQVPIAFYDRHIDDLIADRFHLKRNGVRIHRWKELVEKYVNAGDLPEVNIGIIGKYANFPDAYLSLKEAIYHAGVGNDCRVNIQWIEAEKLEEYSTLRGVAKFFENIHAVIVPGGFDNRGIEGKIRAIQYAREKRLPFLGICLGLQCAVIEFARHICEVQDANSLEFTKDCTPVVHYVEGQESVQQMGGTLRLGSYDCQLAKGSMAHQMYEKRLIKERHRHRYEVNSEFVEMYAKRGFIVSGVNPQSNLVEMMELDKGIHPYFIGCQFHPEFKSRLDNPHPLFYNLIASAIKHKSKPVDNLNSDLLAS